MLLVDIARPSTKFRDPLLEFQYVTKVQLPEIKPIWGYEFRIPCTKQANLREKIVSPNPSCRLNTRFNGVFVVRCAD